MSDIQITVSGHANSGKTTVAMQIKLALEMAGFRVSVDDPDFGRDASIADTGDHYAKLDAIAPMTNIVVKQQQLSRSGSVNFGISR